MCLTFEISEVSYTAYELYSIIALRVRYFSLVRVSPDSYKLDVS
jgi:hypothetical protein